MATPVTLVDDTQPSGKAVGTAANPLVFTSSAGGDAVTIADGADVAEGAKADAAYTDATAAASGSVISLLKAIAKAFLNGNANGRAAAASSTPVVLSTEDRAGDYETVAASQTAQVLGSTGAAGDFIKRVVIIPATVAPGVVTLLDGATSIPLWVGGTVGADLKPFHLDLGMVAASAWKITTGANVSVIGVGKFT
jgi:hypothetical protein